MKRLAPALALLLALSVACPPAPCAAALADEARGYPVVAETWPKDGGVDAPVDAKIMVVFSRAMLRADVNEFTLTLNDGISDLATNVHYNAELKKAVLTPLEDLLPRHVYYVSVSRTLRDVDGNPMGRDHAFKFKTVDAVVKVPPVLSDISPTVGADEVAPDANIEMSFSADLDERTLTEENVAVTAAGKRALGVTRYYPASRKAIFVPDRAFPAGCEVTVRVKGVSDLSGVAMEVPREWSFRVAKAGAAAPEGDSGSPALEARRDKLRRISERMGGEEPPEAYGQGKKIDSAKSRHARPPVEGATVVEQFPASGATNIRMDASVRVGFGFDVNPATLSLFTFSLADGDDFVFGKIDYDKATRRAVFTPAGRLKGDREYTVKLAGKIESTDGRPLGEDLVWTFRTISPTATFSATREETRRAEAIGAEPSAPDLDAPHPVALMPADGQTEVAPNVELRVTFNEPLKDFSVNSFTFRLNDGDGDLDGTIGYDPRARAATFRPKKPLQKDRAYRALLTRGIMDENGNYMLRERTWRFTTGGANAGDGPRIARFSPADGATLDAREFEISAAFAERLDPRSVSNATVRLYEGDARVEGALELSEDRRIVRFKPARALKPETDYAFEVAPGLSTERGDKATSARRSAFRVTAPRFVGNDSSPANSVASSRDARIEMKAVESLMASPIGAAAVADSDFGIGPDEMRKRLSASDKSAVGNVAPRRIADPGLEPPSQGGRTGMLNRSLTGTDLAMSDEVRRDLEKFLASSTPENKRKLDAVNAVNDAEAAMADGMYVAEPPEVSVEGGKTVRRPGATSGRANGLFEDELQYEALSEARRNEPKRDEGKPAARAYPVSNIPRTEKHARGSGTINGVPIDDLEEEGGPPAPQPAGSSLASPLDGLAAGSPPSGSAEPFPAAGTVAKSAPAAPARPARGSAGPDADPAFDGGLQGDPGAFMVTAIHPRRSGDEVRPDDIVTASFNRNVDLATVNAMSFLVTEGEEVVDGKIIFNPRINKVIFRPKEKLKPGGRYKVTLTGAVRDDGGTPLRPLSWEFQTARM